MGDQGMTGLSKLNVESVERTVRGGKSGCFKKGLNLGCFKIGL